MPSPPSRYPWSTSHLCPVPGTWPEDELVPWFLPHAPGLLWEPFFWLLWVRFCLFCSCFGPALGPAPQPRPQSPLHAQLGLPVWIKAPPPGSLQHPVWFTPGTLVLGQGRAWVPKEKASAAQSGLSAPNEAGGCDLPLKACGARLERLSGVTIPFHREDLSQKGAVALLGSPSRLARAGPVPYSVFHNHTGNQGYPG